VKRPGGKTCVILVISELLPLQLLQLLLQLLLL